MKALARGQRVLLRSPVPGDCAELLSLVAASRRLHRPWVQPPSDERAFHAYVSRAAASERFFGTN